MFFTCTWESNTTKIKQDWWLTYTEGYFAAKRRLAAVTKQDWQWLSDREPAGRSPRTTLIKGRHIESFKIYVVFKKNKINSTTKILIIHNVYNKNFCSNVWNQLTEAFRDYSTGIWTERVKQVRGLESTQKKLSRYRNKINSVLATICFILLQTFAMWRKL